MQTTLNKIRDQQPSKSFWRKLLNYLEKNKANVDPLSIITILESNGLDDAIWCLQAVENHDREIRLFAVWCAREVQNLMTSERSLRALEIAEKYANGLATLAELEAAYVAAYLFADTLQYDDDHYAGAWAACYAAYSNAAWAAKWASYHGTAPSCKYQAEELRRVCAAIDAGIDPYPYKQEITA